MGLIAVGDFRNFWLILSRLPFIGLLWSILKYPLKSQHRRLPDSKHSYLNRRGSQFAALGSVRFGLIRGLVFFDGTNLQRFFGF